MREKPCRRSFDGPSCTESAESISSNSARNAKRYLVTDPSGRQFEVVNLERFCRENGLGTTGLHKVANGKAKQYKGWLCEHCQEQNASDHSRK